MILTLSHGQAAIERGFSINKDLIDVNMLEKTITSQRIICDSLSNTLEDNQNKVDFSKVIVNKEMLQYCNRARMNYEIYLTEQRKMKIENKATTERKMILLEITEEKKNQVKWEKAHERLSKEADELALQAEKEKKMSLLVDSNSSRKRASEFTEYLQNSRNKVQKLEDKIKNNT